MPIAIGCVLGGTATLVGSTQQMTAQGLLEDAGVRLFETFDFTLVGGIIVIVGLIYCLTIGRMLAKKIWGNRDENAEFESKATGKEYKKSKMIIVAVIFVTTVVFYITELAAPCRDQHQRGPFVYHYGVYHAEKGSCFSELGYCRKTCRLPWYSQSSGSGRRYKTDCRGISENRRRLD